MGEELVIGLLAHQGDEAFVQRRLIGQGLDVVKHIQPFHLGGDGGGNLTMPINVTYGGERTIGSVSVADGAFTFTADGAV